MGSQAAAARPRRSDAGQARLTERDISGLLLVAEQYAAPYDLLAEALAVTPAQVRAVTARWRAAGYAVTGVLGPGPAWCWLTSAGMAACGHAWPGPASVAVAPGARPGRARGAPVVPGLARLPAMGQPVAVLSPQRPRRAAPPGWPG